MAKKAAKRILDKECPVKDEFNYVSFNMAEHTPDEIADECEMLSLIAEKKTIVAENCAFLSNEGKGKGKKKADPSLKKLTDYCLNPNMNVDLYLLVYSETIDLANPVVSAIKTTGEIKEVPMPTEREWFSAASKYFAKRNCPIDDKALQEFLRRIDGDYARFLTEREKLCAYANGEPITLPVIKMMVSPKLEDDAFQLSNALLRGNRRAAIRIYRDLKMHSIDEVRLIGVLANQFRFLDQVHFLDGKGYSTMEIAEELNCKPMRAEIALRNIAGISPTGLLQAQEELYHIDKAILTGEEPAPFAFERFLSNFSL